MSKFRFMAFFCCFFAVIALFAQENSADEQNKKDDIMQDPASMKQDAQDQAARVSDVEITLSKMNAEAVREKDIKWKVCLDNYLGTVKGMAESASSVAAKIPELVDAGKFEDAKSQLVLLRGLADSAEKSLAESQGCERQLSNNTQNSTIVKEIDSASEEKGANLETESVSDAMNMNIGGDFVTEIDKASVEGSDAADAAGAEQSDVNTGSANAGSSDSNAATSEEPEIIPDPIDQSPTE